MRSMQLTTVTCTRPKSYQDKPLAKRDPDIPSSPRLLHLAVMPTGFLKGRPGVVAIANVDEKPCCVCKIRISKSWKAVACHRVPTQSFSQYDWFCSGVSSGGTENCQKRAITRSPLPGAYQGWTCMRTAPASAAQTPLAPATTGLSISLFPACGLAEG